MEVNSKHHQVFGDVKTLVELTFVKQGYLVHFKKDMDTIFAIGPRGKKEIKVSDIWQHISSVTGKDISEAKRTAIKAEDLQFI